MLPKEELENWAMLCTPHDNPPMETCVVPSDDQEARTCAELSRWPDLDPQGDTSPCGGRRRSAPDSSGTGARSAWRKSLRRVYCDQTFRAFRKRAGPSRLFCCVVFHQQLIMHVGSRYHTL
jgi:hypothetical protein